MPVKSSCARYSSSDGAAMMTLDQIASSASSLASQFRGGVPMNQAVALMADIQPRYAEYWSDVAESIERGNALSKALPDVWPESLVSAVQAGEESGTMEAVFTRITKAIKIQQNLRKSIMKIAYPISIGIVGIVVFIGMMVFVVPNTVKAFGSTKAADNFMTALAMSMDAFFTEYWMIVLGAIATGFVLLAKWAQTEEGKDAILEIGLSIPYLGKGLSELYYGLWAEYMALMTGAGITLIRAVELTAKVVPASMREGFYAFVRDLSVNNLPVNEAVDIKRLAADDPRREWPLFIRKALTLGYVAGATDTELMQVAPELVEQGIEKVERAIFWGNVMATVMAAMLVAMSFFAIYMPIFSAIRTVR